jgi:hypothetical protein
MPRSKGHGVNGEFRLLREIGKLKLSIGWTDRGTILLPDCPILGVMVGAFALAEG